MVYTVGTIIAALSLLGTLPCVGEPPVERRPGDDQILYCRLGHSQLELVRPDGSQREVVRALDLSPYSQAWSADGKSILGSGLKNNGRYPQLYRWDIAAQKIEWLTSDEIGKFRPASLPGTSVLLFARGEWPKWDIGQLDLKTRKEDLILKLGVPIEALVPSPDGRWVALSLGVSKGVDLQLLNVESKTLLAVPAGEGFHTSPAWSPDSGIVAFNTWSGNRARIRRYELKTREIAQLTDRTENCSNPSFSPDGKTMAIAVTTVKDGDTTGGWVEIITPQGGLVRKLAEVEGYYPYQSPQWSPDGLLLAVGSTHVKKSYNDLVILSSDGKRASRITETLTNAGDLCARWRPRPE